MLILTSKTGYSPVRFGDNTLADLAPKLLAQGLMALRSMNVMPMVVNSSYSTDFTDKGETVNVPIPSAIAVQDVAPGNTPPSTADVSSTTVPLTLDQWKEAPFYLTDKDAQKVMRGTIPMQASEAIKAIANEVNSHLFSKYKGVYGYGGSAGTTPFASNTSEATEARKILTNQEAPVSDRRFVMDPDAEANALNLRAFQDANFAATPENVRSGKLTQKFGFQFLADTQVPTHTAGTITTGAVAKSGTAQAIGTKAVTCTTAATSGAVDLKEGDIVTFAGDTQTYVVTSDVAETSASTDFTLNIEPGLKVALSGDEALTVKADHVVNMAFHRDAFGFAARPLTDTQGLGNIIEAMQDPVSGIPLRLEISREHKRTRFSYDLLYGGALIRRELAMREAG